VTAAVVALAAAGGWRVAVVKPAQTGVRPDEPGDLDEVRPLAAVTDLHECARLTGALSPAAAARRGYPCAVRDLPCGVYDPAQARIEAESVKAICELHGLFNEATKLAGAGGTKASLDPAKAQELLDKIAAIDKIFWETKQA
jgi:hypothetical protein